MAIFGSQRDRDFLRKINYELIKRVVNTNVDYWKLDIEQNTVNVYGEAEYKKQYFAPIRIHALIDRNDQQYESDVFGSNYQNGIIAGFLRDELIQESTYPEVGDVFAWDNEYWEVDGVIENQYWFGKNPITYRSERYGYHVSMMVSAHLMDRTKVHLDDLDFGQDPYNVHPKDQE